MVFAYHEKRKKNKQTQKLLVIVTTLIIIFQVYVYDTITIFSEALTPLLVHGKMRSNTSSTTITPISKIGNDTLYAQQVRNRQLQGRITALHAAPDALQPFLPSLRTKPREPLFSAKQLLIF